MLSKNSYGSFDERPEYKAEQSFFRLPFLMPKIVERLLHGLSKLLPESSRIKAEESSVENMNCFRDHTIICKSLRIKFPLLRQRDDALDSARAPRQAPRRLCP